MDKQVNGHPKVRAIALGIESGPRPRPYYKLHPMSTRPVPGSQGPWTVPDLCAAYSWPSSLTGGGTIAIIELGGGWNPTDMATFFHGINQPVPQIIDISVDGTVNSSDPNNDNTPDIEVALDIQIAAASYYCATGKPATIKVYWSRDIASAMSRAAADGCDVCSVSWGLNEDLWPPAAAATLEQAATAATAAGMAIFAAAGDNDSSDGGPSQTNVDLPAAVPHVVACGGTTKRGTDEIVWNNAPGSATGEGTGGGFSSLFPMPSWQIGAPHGPGRMVPDVAANADPATGYSVVVHGVYRVVAGTSAVAPLYAGLFASFGRKLGFVTPNLWSHPVCFRDIVTGDNGAYRAVVGPDPCTGLGAPIGTKLSELLAPAAQTADAVRALREENKQLRAAIVSQALSA